MHALKLFCLLFLVVSAAVPSARNGLTLKESKICALVRQGIHEVISMGHEILGKDLVKVSNQIKANWVTVFRKNGKYEVSGKNEEEDICPIKDDVNIASFPGMVESFQNMPTKADIIKLVVDMRNTFVSVAKIKLNPHKNAEKLKNEMFAIQKIMENKQPSPMIMAKMIISNAPQISYVLQEAVEHTGLEFQKHLKNLKPEAKRDIKNLHLQANKSALELGALPFFMFIGEMLASYSAHLAGVTVGSIVPSQAAVILENIADNTMLSMDQGFMKSMEWLGRSLGN